jgi:hypothetical protein
MVVGIRSALATIFVRASHTYCESFSTISLLLLLRLSWEYTYNHLEPKRVSVDECMAQNSQN